MTTLDELKQLLGVCPNPGTDHKEFIRLSCKVEFEPHGRASETWEWAWYLVLPQIPHHWKSTTGWRRGTTDQPMRFKGRTAQEVTNKAAAFLKELRNDD